MIDPIRSAREELAAQNFASAINIVSTALEPQNASKWTRLQTERLRLLRADGYSMVRNHNKALDDALAAIKLSESQSPQAHFVAGREHLLLLNIKESVDNFEIAETLMVSPPQPEEGEEDTEDELAKQGLNPKEHTASALRRSQVKDKVDVTYEWVSDLAQWRKYGDEAKAMSTMLVSHVIPGTSLRSAISLMTRRVAQSASRGIVITLLNNTGSPLHFEFEYFIGGEYYDDFRFPATIPANDAAVACAQSSSWTSGANGIVVYSLNDRKTAVMLSFESPLMGSFKCGVRMASVTHLHKQCQASPGRMITGRGRSATMNNSEGRKFSALSGVPSIVQSFVVAKVTPSPLSDQEMFGVLEFLHSTDLKRVSTACKKVRSMVNQLPPNYFFGTMRRAYPDYCLKMDFQRNPWMVQDAKPVSWRLRYEGPYVEKDELSIVDEYTNRIFMVFAELQSKSLDSVWSYGTRKCPCGLLEETRMPFYKHIYVKMPGGRQVAVINMKKDCITMQRDADSPSTAFLTAVRSAAEPREIIVTQEPTKTIAAVLRPCGSSSSPMMRQKDVAEIILHPRADALMVCMMCLVARFKWD